jgi:hypothetical protein
MGVVMGKDVGEKISQRWTNLDEKRQNTLAMKDFLDNNGRGKFKIWRCGAGWGIIAIR